jgi:hypothetical protein
MDILNTISKITMILYSCQKFVIDKHHIGLFGTLIRFFPLFDFKNNDARSVFIVDADVVKKAVDNQFKLYDTIIKKKLEDDIYIAYAGSFYHVNNSHGKVINHNNNKYLLPYCLADSIVGFKKLSKKPFLKFMAKLSLYMNETTMPKKILSNYYIDPAKYKIKCENNICFGVDEYFINDILLKYMLKNNKPFCYHNIFEIASFNFYKHPDSPELRMYLNKMTNDEYKMIYDEHLKNIGIEKYNYAELDEELYTEKDGIKATTFMQNYANKIIRAIKNARKSKNTTIYNKHDYYYLKDVDYKKYYKLEYIKFINIPIDTVHLGEGITYK